VKVLLLTTKSPYPLYEGRALRTYNLIKQAAIEHEIHLLSFVQTAEEAAGIEHMRSICASVESVPLHMGNRLQVLGDVLRELFSSSPLLAVKYRSRAMKRHVAKALQGGGFDLVHLDMLHLGDYIAESAPVPVLIVEHNVESTLFERRIDAERGWLKKLYFRYQLRKLRRYEASTCARADHVVAVSAADASELESLCRHDRVTTIPNGVDTEFFMPRDARRLPHSLVFVGGLTWFPNLDAIRFFCAEVLPLIAEHIPDVTLTVVGKNPPQGVDHAIASNPRVRLTGLVEDVRPLIDAAQVYVVPLRVGGGTRLKILDALAMGKPLVSTSVGCEGLRVTHGEHLSIADGPREFAAEAVRLLRDGAAAAALARGGRALVQEKYEWRVIAGELMSVYRGCAARLPGYCAAGRAA
jgi:polysaccharide biosynthesis protein PslH